MRAWFRISPMGMGDAKSYRETWLCRDHDNPKTRGAESSYEVNVCLGKPIDILSLKAREVSDFAAHVSRVRSSRIALFASSHDIEIVERCPICRSPAGLSEFRINVYGAMYHQCPTCTHCFVINRPALAALEKFYSTDKNYASTYTDAQISAIRLRDVAVPKATWVVKQYASLYGQEPMSVLDVGAGGGHFVYACKQMGIRADGIELSRPSREFCKETFGFELHALDITTEWKQFLNYDVVTFWGVIEHVPEPMRLLNAASNIVVGKNSLVVAEVPRWNCLSTALQRSFRESVVRHLDPLGHIHCFTDTSLATAFEASGFAPAAVWYFGMDVYELTMQLSHLLGESGIKELMGKHILPIQDTIDRAFLSDEMVLAGRPIRSASSGQR